MGTSRRKHTREFKVEAVRQILEKGRSVSEVADGLGINRNMLTRWKIESEADGAEAFRGHGKLTAVDEELRELRRKLATAEEERDILKKALGYFAKPRK
jgi:transposase